MMMPDLPPRPAHVTTQKHIDDANAELDAVLKSESGKWCIKRVAKAVTRKIADSDARVSEIMGQ